MHARRQGNTVHTSSKTRPVSAARAQVILSRIPRDQTVLISGLGKDWKDIDEGVVSTIAEALSVSIRVYGHQAIIGSLPDLERNPDGYHTIAHEVYVTSAKLGDPILLSGAQIRQLFPQIEFSSEQMRAIMRQAATHVKQTPDEPKLIVKATGPDFIVTFAT